MATTIDYRVKFGYNPKENKEPLSIARMITTDTTNYIEYCNSAHGWILNPDKASMFFGSVDNGYGSPPDGEVMPQKFIDGWVDIWSKNWTKDSLK
mgnify:CR=1 FL=1|tara:strand:+ start:1220 stop:1504 length:285 start_codon:yes stop_codon:yes gene_type:complete